MNAPSLVSVGFGNMVSSRRVVAVINPNSLPMKKLRDDARERGKLIDATEGRKTRSVIVTDSDHLVLSALQVETIAQRISGVTIEEEGGGDEEKEG